MAIEKISLKNVTVFDELSLSFSPGINVLIGQNGVGKTHVLKIIYSACRAADPKVSFSHKLVRCFAPDDYRISRLVQRKRGNNDATIRVISQGQNGQRGKTISASFNKKTPRWEADVTGEDGWERQLESFSSIFIPAKEILSHSYKLNAAVEMNNVSFDDTYLDIINAAKISIVPGKNPVVKQRLLERIEKIINGKVFFDEKRDEFYLKKGGTTGEFNLEAEGIRKIALLWQLAKNGILVDGAVLFWDEPEANINPVHIPIIVELLLELQQNGVQIFISTHDYFLAKYFEVLRTNQDNIQYHSFYFSDDKQVHVESNSQFGLLKSNPILETFITLYKEEMDKVMK